MRSQLFLSAPIVLAFLSVTPGPEEIVHRPTAGLALRKSFVLVSENASDSTDSDGDTSRSESSSTFSAVVTDVILEVEGERVLKLKRTYDEISIEGEGYWESDEESDESSFAGTSEIEGATVLFAWDEESEEYSASSEDLDDDVLEKLSYDFDFTMLLPDGEVSVDDHWSIDAERFEGMFAMWEGLPLDWDTGDSETSEEEAVEPDVERTTEGELTATFHGPRDEKGVEVAVITLEGTIEESVLRDVEDTQEWGSHSFHEDRTGTSEVAGEILWNLASGHLHSISLQVESEGESRSTNTSTSNGQEHSFEHDESYTGSTTVTITFKVVE